MPTLSAFMRAYPDVELDLDFTDRLVHVVEERFDAVVRTGEASDSWLMSRVLGSCDYRIVGTPDYLARHGTPRDLQDLARHACLRHRYPSTGKLKHWPLKLSDGAAMLTLPTSFAASTLESLIYLAEHGFGLACLPIFTIRRQLAEARLVSVLEASLDGSGIFRVLCLSNRQMPHKLRVFVEFMGERLFDHGRPGEAAIPLPAELSHGRYAPMPVIPEVQSATGKRTGSSFPSDGKGE